MCKKRTCGVRGGAENYRTLKDQSRITLRSNATKSNSQFRYCQRVPMQVHSKMKVFFYLIQTQCNTAAFV